MYFIHIDTTSPGTTIPTAILQDERLSFEALGFLVFVLGCNGADFEGSVSHLVIEELVDAGYVSTEPPEPGSRAGFFSVLNQN